MKLTFWLPKLAALSLSKQISIQNNTNIKRTKPYFDIGKQKRARNTSPCETDRIIPGLCKKNSYSWSVNRSIEN